MSEQVFVIPGNVVSKKNSKRPAMVGGKHVKRHLVLLPSSAYQRWERQARQHIQLKRPAMLKVPLWVEAHFYYKGNRPDLSGALESIADCMEGILWENDRLIVSWDKSRLHHDLKDPRTIVIIREMPDAIGQVEGALL